MYDFDDDDIEELVLVGSYNIDEQNAVSGHSFSLFDIVDDQVVTVIDKELLFYDVGGPNAHVSAAKVDGKSVLVVYTDNGETGTKAHRTNEYKIWDLSNNEITTAQCDYLCKEVMVVEECRINDEVCANDEYEKLVDSIEIIISADTFGNIDEDESKDIYEMIRHIQKEAGIKAEQKPQHNKQEVDIIVESLWADCLNRDQGFDWKIFKEESIIIDGVEQYCYTLRNNSIDDSWRISEYLFYDSVTGEYGERLN